MRNIIRLFFALTLSLTVLFSNITVNIGAQNIMLSKSDINEPDPLSNTYNRPGKESEKDSKEYNSDTEKISELERTLYPEIIGIGKATANLNVRQEASTSSDIVLTLSKDSNVKIISKNGDWYRISYYKYSIPNDTQSPKIFYEGYVHGAYISYRPIKEKGIDVSKWNGNIDWEKVKASGIDYAIIRAGYGSDTVDPKFKSNIEGAIKAGIKIGVYWFSYASSPEKAIGEAKKCLEQIEPYRKNISYPVFFDFEKASADWVEKNHDIKVTQELGTSMARAFMNTIEKNGYNSGLYTGVSLQKYFSDDILTTSYTWLAQYSYRTTYTKPFFMWQYGDDGSVNGIDGAVDMNYTFSDYKDCVPQNIMNFVHTSKTSNSINLSWSMVSDATGYELYRMNNKSNNYELISTLDKMSTSYEDNNLNSNTTYKYKIRPYKLFNGSLFYGNYTDVLGITTDEDIINTIGESVIYRAHVESYGWQGWKSNGQMSGTTGESKRLEGIEIKLNNFSQGANILYQTHVESYGWQEWKKNGEMAGTEGESKRLEGIKIKLENLPGYSVEYRVHIEDYGWQEWKKDGELAGTTGESKRLEGIEIKIIKEKIPEIQYRVHAESYGWLNLKKDGELAGTTGESKRLEGIEINLNNVPEGANILYQTHVESYGWQEWKKNGEMAGTEGESKRLEGIKIKLENLPGYSVEYRVHIEDYGWQGWKKNGEMAGTEGESKRLEAIEIRISKN